MILRVSKSCDRACEREGAGGVFDEAEFTELTDDAELSFFDDDDDFFTMVPVRFERATTKSNNEQQLSNWKWLGRGETKLGWVKEWTGNVVGGRLRL